MTIPSQQIQSEVSNEDTNIPTVSTTLNIDEGELSKKRMELVARKKTENEWIKEAGYAFYQNLYFLKKTNGDLAYEYSQERIIARKTVKEIKVKARRLGVDLQRIKDSSFVAKIQHCPTPNPKDPAATEVAIKEIHEIVQYLTTHPHHRKRKGEKPEIPLYRWANYNDRKKITHEIKEVGRPPIGCRLFEGRWIYPNNDPITNGKTKYQEAVEVNFGNLLHKYTASIRKINEGEVREMENGKTQKIEGLLEEESGDYYFIKNRNGRGSLLIRGFHKKFESNKVFFVTLIKAAGEYRKLQELEGFHVSIRCARNGFIPKNTLNKPRVKIESLLKIISRALKKSS